jgi:hypothetical protein
MGKKQDPGTLDHIPESFEPIFWVKILNYFMRFLDGKNSDPGWKTFGSGINIPE